MSNLAPVLVGGEALLDFISTEIGSDELVSLMHCANAAAAIVATRVGAAEANPTRQEVEQFLATH
jgi:hypothetical protein